MFGPSELTRWCGGSGAEGRKMQPKDEEYMVYGLSLLNITTIIWPAMPPSNHYGMLNIDLINLILVVQLISLFS